MKTTIRSQMPVVSREWQKAEGTRQKSVERYSRWKSEERRFKQNSEDRRKIRIQQAEYQNQKAESNMQQSEGRRQKQKRIDHHHHCPPDLDQVWTYSSDFSHLLTLSGAFYRCIQIYQTPS
ncbi:conserved hypothetical protein [Culex quinquefasciatus]|uniref:Uncharacterized protein n=1 Tax=Culex quinquefasciatus TaxID=7176 RepID=B0XC86_CULQU|nr:conserved hypothetical protein [Culex quinquefasciatus]|eukprot:XP_001867258.1 conserved hypothetical protein [Culex quinquefasciatus]